MKAKDLHLLRLFR